MADMRYRGIIKAAYRGEVERDRGGRELFAAAKQRRLARRRATTRRGKGGGGGGGVLMTLSM